MRIQGHVRHLGGDRWRLYVALDPDPLTGRRRQASRVVRAASKREAARLLPAFTVEARSALPKDPVRARNVDGLLDAWLAHVAGNVAGNTLSEWRGTARRYLRPHVGQVQLDALSTYRIDGLYRSLRLGGGEEGRPLSPSTVRKAHGVMRLALAQAVRWGWLPTNPAAGATLPAGERRDLEPPDVAARSRLLAAAEAYGDEWSAALRLAIVTGCRRSELCGLQWRDVDLDGGMVSFRRVVRIVDGRAEVADRTKTAASTRTIALAPPTVAALRSWRAVVARRALALGASLDSDAFVFAGDLTGRRPRHPGAVTAKFGRIRADAGLPGVRLHDLRHAFATELLAAGVDVRTVAGRGGWANANVLLRTYAHFVPARDQAAAEILDGLLQVPVSPSPPS